MNPTDLIDVERLRDDVPDFAAGDTLKVHVRVVEGSRERVQIFQGVVIRRQGGGLRETFTVRKVSFGVGVERTFPVHSPVTAQIEVMTRGDVRRAKLYYLRDRVGKRARIRSKQLRKGEVLGAIPETQPEPYAVEIAERPPKMPSPKSSGAAIKMRAENPSLAEPFVVLVGLCNPSGDI